MYILKFYCKTTSINGVLNMYNKSKIFLITLALSISACGSTSSNNGNAIPSNNNSGFLSDYGQLKPVDVDDDSQLTRFISKELKARNYTKVMLDPISYYPAPKATDTVSQKVLGEISQYFNKTLATAVAKEITVVNEAGEGTLRFKMAITGVKILDKELSAYQYIPIAFVINAASGGLSDVEVHFQIEAEVVDSLTGEVMASAVKSGIGETLSNNESKLTLANLKPLIDKWAKVMQNTIKHKL
jgi:hypothetical protein